MTPCLGSPGIDINAKKVGGQTALFLAVKQKHKEIIELLRAHGAK
jgi:ankyrin repeat protein